MGSSHKSGRGFTAFFVVAMTLSGCSVGDVTVVRNAPLDGGAGGAHPDDSDAGAVPVSAADFFPELAKAICENLGPCCAAEAKPFGLSGCEASLLSKFDKNVSSSGDAGVPDAETLGRCIDAYRKDAKSCFVTTNSLSACPGKNSRPSHAARGDACGQNCYSGSAPGEYSCIYNGSPSFETEGGVGGASSAAPSDSACWQDDDLYCPHDPGETRVCRSRVDVGSPCTDSAACRDGFCNGTTCVPLGQSGATCSQTPECVSGLYCNRDAVGTPGPGVCTDRQPDHTPCTTSEACQSGKCDTQSSHQCVPVSFMTVFAPIACVP